MKTKMTLHQVYMKLTELRESRGLIAMCIAEAVLDDNHELLELLKDNYKHTENLINYYSEIEVEF